MIRARLDWDGDTALSLTLSAAWEGLRRAALHLWEQCQVALNVSNPRPYVTPSKPGEPPRKRTGWGQRHVGYEFDKKALAARVGVGANAAYMAILEIARDRPWLLATLRKVMPRLESLAAGR